MPRGSLEGGLRTVMVIIRHISSADNIATLWEIVKVGRKGGHNNMKIELCDEITQICHHANMK